MKIKKIIYMIFGSIFTFLGIIGIFLPLLPTTPFLLLAAWFYAKSSKKFYNWLINHKLLGKYIRNYIQEKGMTKKDKIKTLLLLWGTILLSLFLLNNLHIRIFLSLVLVGVSTHIFLLKTLGDNSSDRNLNVYKK